MSVRKALRVAAVAILQLLRDRIALFLLVVLPLVITLFIGLSVYRPSQGIPIGVTTTGAGALGDDLAARFVRSPALEVRSYADAEALRRAVRGGTIAAGVIVPAGYDQALRAGRDESVQFLLDPAQSVPVGVRTAVAAAVADQDAAARTARLAAVRPGVTFDDAYAGAASTPARSVTVESAVVAAGKPRSYPLGFSYPAASNVILFMFITSLGGAAALIRTKQLGIAQRILATPTTPATLVVGMVLGRLGIALFEAAVIIAVGIGLFRVDFGDLPGVVALVAAFALVATAIGVLLGTVLRTPEQASSIAAPLGIALGMLGGTMWPLEIVPATMRTVGHLTPHAWAMDAFIALMGKGADVAGIMPQLLVLLGMAVILLPLAAIRLRGAIVR